MHTFTGSSGEFHRKASGVARHYGFAPFDEISAASSSVHEPRSHNAVSIHQELKKFDPFLGELSMLFGRAIEKNILPVKEPVLLYETNQDKKNPAPKTIRFGIHMIGTRASIAEAIVLKTAYSILEENGINRSVIHLNSIGDRDSSAKFGREATQYMRRHVDDLPDDAREVLKDDVFATLALLTRIHHPVLFDLPRSVEFLTSASRKHLREVIEFIETAGIPYELDDMLLGHRDYYTQTLFEIQPLPEAGDGAGEIPEPYARGGRFDELLRRVVRTSAPSVSIVLSLPTNPSARQVSNASHAPQKQAIKKPLIVFIHVGFEAKLRSISVIETFRKAHISFCQCLHHDKLTDQLAYAEQFLAPYTVIMGQKEALGNNVIVRDSATRAQQTVSIDLLPSYIKSMQRK